MPYIVGAEQLTDSDRQQSDSFRLRMCWCNI